MNRVKKKRKIDNLDAHLKTATNYRVKGLNKVDIGEG